MEENDVKCLRSKNDITLGLSKKHHLLHCPQCKTYSEPLKSCIQSNQLLDLCLKLLGTNLTSNNVRLVRSQTVPSQPDSKIIKISATVQKEVLDGETLEQSYIVEFVQHKRVCESCNSIPPDPDQWNFVVQLRRRDNPMPSFLRIQHAIFKHRVAANAVKINNMKHGTDYFFADRVHVNKLFGFIKGLFPVRISESKELVSHDTNDFKYTFSVHSSPICSEDLIFLPSNVASSLKNIGPIVICTRVTNVITLFDPLTLAQCCLDGDMYWRAPFKSLLASKDLVEYIILDVKEVCSEVIVNGKKFGLANAEVARVKDLGKNETTFKIKTHLGYLLKTGDHAYGYDLWEAKFSDSEIELKEQIGDGVILIKKTHASMQAMKRRRAKDMLYLKDLEKITNQVLGISLGDEEPPLEEMLGGLNLTGEEDKVKKKARRTA